LALCLELVGGARRLDGDRIARGERLLHALVETCLAPGFRLRRLLLLHGMPAAVFVPVCGKPDRSRSAAQRVLEGGCSHTVMRAAIHSTEEEYEPMTMKILQAAVAAAFLAATTLAAAQSTYGGSSGSSGSASSPSSAG